MKRLMPYFFIGPALLALVALVVYPLLYGVYISFFKTNLANKWDFVGLKNYISVFSEDVYKRQVTDNPIYRSILKQLYLIFLFP